VDTRPESSEMGWMEAHTDTFTFADPTTRISAKPDTASREGARKQLPVSLVATEIELHRVAHKSVP
jgi:hypothetical protein